MRKRSLVLMATLIIGSLVYTGCGSNSGNGDTSADAEKKTVVVSMDGATAPFNYQNDDGELEGYEVDLLHEIEERAGDIEFEFNVTEWDSIFASLDSKKADIIINNITKKPEREEKYLFSDYSYYNNHTVIVVPKGENSIQTIDDLQGKSIEVSPGTAVTLFLEEYNEEHTDNPIDLVYSEAKTATLINDIAMGRYPAGIWSESYVVEAVDQLGIEVDTASIENEEDIQSSEAWFLYGADEEELKEEIDPILKEIIDDGTLSELSVKWFGDDYTK